MRTWIVPGLLFAFTGAQAQQPWTLEQCVKRAEEKNIALLNAALDAELAGQAQDQSYWDLLPNLNGGATHGYNFGRVIDRYTNTFATDRVQTDNFYLSSSMSLFEGLRKQNTIKRSNVDVEAAEKGIEAARNDIRLTVVQAFLDVVGLRERKAAAEAQAANTRQQIERTTALVAAGRLARADLLALQSQLAQEEYTVVDLSNQQDQRLLALGRALQLDAEETRTFDIAAPAITDDRIQPPVITADEVLGNVLHGNPAYARAELQAQSAEFSVAIAKAGVLPSLVLNGSLATGFSGRNYEPVGDPTPGAPMLIGETQGGELVYAPTYNYDTRLVPFSRQLDENLNRSFSFTLNVPLFNNMSNRYNISQARVQQ
ncbi:MAG TPA: TolC family protein, partial [Flavobacteriales bacterium]|nr:TolC family protein [Flavobacteriales bacterium]